MSKKIGILIGSLRSGSFSRMIANAAIKLAPEDIELEIVEIGQLPFYNQDFDDGGLPEEWATFRSKIKELDGYLFITPEYNRSFTAPIKNALDGGSRPYGHSVWDGKPAAIMSITPGGLGAFGANHHLRQPMVFLNLLTMQQPEFYLSNVHTLIDANGQVTDEDTIHKIQEFLKAFSTWVYTVSK